MHGIGEEEEEDDDGNGIESENERMALHCGGLCVWLGYWVLGVLRYGM